MALQCADLAQQCGELGFALGEGVGEREGHCLEKVRSVEICSLTMLVVAIATAHYMSKGQDHQCGKSGNISRKDAHNVSHRWNQALCGQSTLISMMINKVTAFPFQCKIAAFAIIYRPDHKN